MDLLDPGPETYKDFLLEWHGPHRPAYGLSRAETEGHVMPTKLREFLEFAGDWPGVVAQNHLLRPSEMWHEDDKLVFYVENQSVDIWATASTAADDAPVWSRENEPGKAWVEEEPLSRFLLQLVVYETVITSREGAAAAWLPLNEVERLTRRLNELPLKPWHRPSYPTRFYMGDRILVVAVPNPGPGHEAYVSLFAGARDAQALEILADLVDDSWEYFSPRDGVARR